MSRPNENAPTSASILTLRRGDASGEGRAPRVACVASTYHAELVDRMVDSARATLKQAGLADADFLHVTAPGVYELPIVAQRFARRDDIDAVLTFGLVLKGETDHDVHIAGAVSRALINVGLATDTPVLFGVLTCSTLGQAEARSRHLADGGLDKGGEVARAAIAVLHSLRATEESR